MSDSPAAVIVDAQTEQTASVNPDGSLKTVDTAASASLATIRDTANLEATQVQVSASLANIRDNVAQETTLISLSSSNAQIRDSIALDTSVQSLITAVAKEATLAAVSSSLNLIRNEMAKEITLAAVSSSLEAIRLTDGIKKIEDGVQLQAGTNTVGGVRLRNAADNAYISTLLEDAVQRLRTETIIAPGQSVSIGAPVPKNPTNIVRQKLLNTGSSDMLVDGDPTPVIFRFDADPTDDIKIGEIRLVFSANAIDMDGGSFGSRGDLSNGCLLEVNASGTLATLANIQKNEDFLSFPGGVPFLDRSGVRDVLAVSYTLGGAVRLVGGSSDYIRMTIRDDIDANNFKFFEATVYGVKV